MSGSPTFNFRLYVAGEAVNSARAQANLLALCQHHLAGRHHIEVVDVFLQPARALADGISMTPTLIRLSPQPMRKVVGTLSDTATLMQALQLPPADGAQGEQR
ncbi:MAG: circadian clock KaiB family protein [Rubrivivax sp.]|nr:circadian clock KaiB family protein [Rubrivivax sp.]MDP3225930.1 circadian clock KaiB family protein [Rubrivivax sp.]MDP3611733.1 circadian clock KaiB family protein [Rubrivivax sp.]